MRFPWMGASQDCSDRPWTAFALLVAWTASSCASSRSGVEIDVREAPDTRAWMQDAGSICRDWIPRLHARLAPSSPVPQVHVRLVAKTELVAPAATSGSTILIRADEIRAHPGNVGMVIHELAHVLQNYPPPAPAWLIEGIADYVRYYVFEPGTNQRFDPGQLDFRKGYWPASAFLDWIQTTYDPDLVPALHAVLRAGCYGDELFRERTGKPLEDLWQEFLLAARPEFLPRSHP